jgi:hypothetical protein
MACNFYNKSRDGTEKCARNTSSLKLVTFQRNPTGFDRSLRPGTATIFNVECKTDKLLSMK